jgi:hypothetical protein
MIWNNTARLKANNPVSATVVDWIKELSNPPADAPDIKVRIRKSKPLPWNTVREYKVFHVAKHVSNYPDKPEKSNSCEGDQVQLPGDYSCIRPQPHSVRDCVRRDHRKKEHPACTVEHCKNDTGNRVVRGVLNEQEIRET